MFSSPASNLTTKWWIFFFRGTDPSYTSMLYKRCIPPKETPGSVAFVHLSKGHYNSFLVQKGNCQYKFLHISNSIEVFKEPVPRTKKIPHCPGKFEVREEWRMKNGSLYWPSDPQHLLRPCLDFRSGGSGVGCGAPPLRPKIVSISCSFMENFTKMSVGATRKVGGPSYRESWIRPCFVIYTDYLETGPPVMMLMETWRCFAHTQLFQTKLETFNFIKEF